MSISLYGENTVSRTTGHCNAVGQGGFAAMSLCYRHVGMMVLRLRHCYHCRSPHIYRVITVPATLLSRVMSRHIAAVYHAQREGHVISYAKSIRLFTQALPALFGYAITRCLELNTITLVRRRTDGYRRVSTHAWLSATIEHQYHFVDIKDIRSNNHHGVCTMPSHEHCFTPSIWRQYVING